MSTFSKAIENRDAMQTALEAAHTHGKAEGKAEAVKEIVAWLRDHGTDSDNCIDWDGDLSDICASIADAIERGAHLNTGKDER